MDKFTGHDNLNKPEMHVSLDGFEGPLDLLLTLAKNQKVDLKKLQLGILADQFLNYLRDQRYKLKLEFAGDYLVMAAWLTLLKSQLIIPEDELENEDTEKINELIALRLQRLAKIREKATWLFERPRFLQDFFPSYIKRDEKVIKENFLTVQLGDILKTYLAIVDKKNYEVPMDTKEQYLVLDRAISFIDQKVKGSYASLSFSNLVKEIHALSGISTKRCVASIFCGLLEYTKLGKIQIKQSNIFASLELDRVRNATKS